MTIDTHLSAQTYIKEQSGDKRRKENRDANPSIDTTAKHGG